ncbi:MAG: zinc metalloprotease HtpX, partial [Actinomycetota bacterium]
MLDLIKSNVRRSWLLIAAFVIVAAAMGLGFGYLFNAGPIGLLIAAPVAVVYAWGSYVGGDKVVLAISRAKPVTPAQEPRLH